MVFLNNTPKRGPSFDFYNRLTISSPLFGGDDGYSVIDGYSCNAIIPFSTQGLQFILETATCVVEGSFNGTDVHFRLDTTTANIAALQKLTFENRVNSLIWLRVVSGGPATVQILAWATR